MFEEVVAIQRELWSVHFRLAPPMVMSMQLFDELRAELLDGTDGTTLLLGGYSGSVKAGLALGDLTTSARTLVAGGRRRSGSGGGGGGRAG